MQGTYVVRKHLAAAKQAIRSYRILIEGAESWLDGDDMVFVHRVYDRSVAEQIAERLGRLEDTLAGLLALCEELT